MQDDEIKIKVYDFGLLKRMFMYTRPYKHLMFLAVFLIITASFFQLLGPYFTKLAIDDYIKSGNLNGLYLIVILYFAALILTFVFVYAIIGNDSYG